MSPQFKRLAQICLTSFTVLQTLPIMSCSGQDFGLLQPTPKDLCKCLPIEPDIADYRHLATFRRKNAVSEATLITCGRNGVVFAVQFHPAQVDQRNREVDRFRLPAGRDSARSGSHYRRSHSVPPNAACHGIRDTSNDAYHVAVSVR